MFFNGEHSKSKYLNLKGEKKMNTNEIMANEEVIETTEEIVTANSGKGIKMAAGIVALAVLGGVGAYRYIVKPMVAKIKAKKEQQAMEIEIYKNEEFDNFEDAEIDE